MTEDVKPEIIKATQDILGKFIKKPILTEKLLKKPPFRFLHDICTSIMKETGFFSGVINSPEYMLENIKDKEGKIAFLQKVIAAVEAANGIKLTVKPNKIVAGLEASKTNEFLQALGKAVKKQQLESKTTKAQPSKTKTQRSHSKEVKEKSQDKKHSSNKTSKPILENGMPEPNDDNNKKQSETVLTVSPKKKHSTKKNEEINAKIEKKVVEKKPKEKNLEKEAKADALEEKKNEKNAAEQIIVNEAGESVDLPNEDRIPISNMNGKGDQNTEVKETVQDKDLKRNQTEKQKHRRSSIHSTEEHAKASEISNEVNKNEPLPKNVATDKINLLNKSESVLQEQNRITPSPPEQLNSAKKDINLARERTLISRPRTNIRSSTARPASARPAAPRIRERSEVTAVEETAKPTSGKVNVIVDQDVSNETEDDNLISLETTNDILLEEISVPPVLSDPTTTQQREHGHLVEQILEVQKELEDDGRLSLAEEKFVGKTEIEWEADRNAESATREIEKLRSNIQTLTRSVNPLGKLLDYFEEDIESIQRELETWRSKNSSYCVQIAHERSVTEQFVEPLKIQLKEIQQSIEEEYEQISLVKANIIRNNQKIRKLLAGV